MANQKNTKVKPLKKGKWFTYQIQYGSKLAGFVWCGSYFRRLYQKYGTQWVWDKTTMLYGEKVDWQDVAKKLYQKGHIDDAIRIVRYLNPTLTKDMNDEQIIDEYLE